MFTLSNNTFLALVLLNNSLSISVWPIVKIALFSERLLPFLLRPLPRLLREILVTRSQTGVYWLCLFVDIHSTLHLLHIRRHRWQYATWLIWVVPTMPSWQRIELRFLWLGVPLYHVRIGWAHSTVFDSFRNERLIALIFLNKVWQSLMRSDTYLHHAFLLLLLKTHSTFHNHLFMADWLVLWHFQIVPSL